MHSIYNVFTHYNDHIIVYHCTLYCVVCVFCFLLMVLALRFSQITQSSCEFWISRTVPTLHPSVHSRSLLFKSWIGALFSSILTLRASNPLHFLFCLGMFLGNTVDVTDSNLDPTFTGQTPEEAWRCMKGWGRQTLKQQAAVRRWLRLRWSKIT